MVSPFGLFRSEPIFATSLEVSTPTEAVTPPVAAAIDVLICSASAVIPAGDRS
jgi:hypothetical protein